MPSLSIGAKAIQSTEEDLIYIFDFMHIPNPIFKCPWSTTGGRAHEDCAQEVILRGVGNSESERDYVSSLGALGTLCFKKFHFLPV